MEAKIYRFEKITDFLELDEQQFERMLLDLKAWFPLAKEIVSASQVMEALLRTETGESGVKMVAQPGFHWCDDDEVGKATLVVAQRFIDEDGNVKAKHTAKITLEDEE